MVWVANGIGLCALVWLLCTDFLVVHEQMAADSMSAARRTPLIAAIPKWFFRYSLFFPE